MLLLLMDELLLVLLLQLLLLLLLRHLRRLQDFGVALDLNGLVMSPPRRSRLGALGRRFGGSGP